jgi:hypothetical protein
MIGNWITMRPQLVLAQVEVVVPRNSIATRINLDCAKETWIGKQMEPGTAEQLPAVVDSALPVPEGHKQSHFLGGLNRSNFG